MVFLGHIVSWEGIKLDTQKIEEVQNGIDPCLLLLLLLIAIIEGLWSVLFYFIPIDQVNSKDIYVSMIWI